MATQNSYNLAYASIEERARRRQEQVNLQREDGLIPQPTPQAPVENPRYLGVEMTPNSDDKGLGRKILEDAAMLAYAIPVGLAKAVTEPITFAKQVPGALVQSVKDAVDPDYYKAHPLLGVVNLAGFVAPIAGAAKSAGVNTGIKVATNTAMREAVTLGVEQSVLKSAFKSNVIKGAVTQGLKEGNMGIVSEVVRNSLIKGGVAEDVALRVGTTMADNLYTTFSRQTTKMQILEGLAHPVASTGRVLDKATSPIRQALFGSPAKTAVAKIYGADVVAKNPEGFLPIERWAEMQVNERGLTNTVANRQRVMNEWVEQNSQWASLTPEERVAHFRNYAEQDLTRLKLHEATGIDIVTTKALPESYVTAMRETVESAPKNLNEEQLVQLMEDTFGNDFKIHSAEVKQALMKGGDPREVLISVVSKLGSARSTVSFAKFSPEIQQLASQLEKTGYRIGHAPTNKDVSFASDIFSVEKRGASKVLDADALARRSTFGNWIEKLGFSTENVVEGAAEYTYRQNFTQRLLQSKVGATVKAKSINSEGMVTIPVEKVFEWLDKNKHIIRGSRKEATLPARTVFDLVEDDFVRAGFEPNVARELQRISKESLRAVPASVIGMGDVVVNFLKTGDKGFGKWWSNFYNPYLKAAYRLRYDLSPFFSAQQWLETRINASMFLKNGSMLSDVGFLPGGKTAMKLGRWTSEKLAERLKSTEKYLPKIIGEPSLPEQVIVRDEVLGTLQKTMLDYTSAPDLINIMSDTGSKLKGLAGESAFQQSIQSRNWWFAIRGESSVRMATQFNKALAEKFGMTIEQALDYTYQNGQKVYKNPQMLKMMRESTQSVFHYKEGFMNSPLAKTMNIVWFPFRFQAKTTQMASAWLGSLSPVNRLLVVNNWVNFANWAGTEEGIQWRRTNRNYFYQILAYATAYEQMGTAIEAVSKGRLFGGNTGLIGGVPFGFMVNIARELAYLPEDPDQFDPKTGRRFMKETPREVPSAAALSVAIEQLLIQMMPSMPLYSLTAGVISGVSTRKYTENLVRMFVGGIREGMEGRDPTEGKERLERDFKRVPLEYNRLAE